MASAHVHINIGTEKHVKIPDLSDNDIMAMTAVQLKKLCREEDITAAGKKKEHFVEAIVERRKWMLLERIKQVSDPRSTT